MNFENRSYKSGILKIFCIFVAALVALSGSYLYAQDKGKASMPASFRVFTLRNITARQGQEYLEQIGITTVSQLASLDTLLVTASERQLIEATAIMDLVDSDEKYEIKTVFTIGQDKPLPSNSSIEATLGDIEVGTFGNLPMRGEKQRAIIDIHENAVVAVAPVREMDRIVGVIEQLQKESKAATKAKVAQVAKEAFANEPAEEPVAVMGEPEPEFKEVTEREEVGVGGSKAEHEPFDKLLQLLDDAKKASAELEKIDGQKAGAKSGVGVAQEPVEDIIELPEGLSLTDLLKLGMDYLNLNYIYDSNEVKTDLPLDIKGEVRVSELYPLIQSVLKLKGLGAVRYGNFVTITNEPYEAAGADRVGKLTSGSIDIDLSAPSAPERRISYEPNDIKYGNEELTLDLPEKLEIIHLLRLAGEYLKLDYMYDPAQVKGEIYLSLQDGKIKVKDLYGLLQNVMEFKGFVMTRHKNIVTIYPVADVEKSQSEIFGDGERPIETSDIVIKRVFRLKYIDTDDAQKIISDMKYGLSYAAVPERGMLIVTGYTHLMPQIEKLLSLVDTPGKKKQYRFRVLQHTMAANLLPRVQSLAEQLEAVSVSIESETPAAAPPSRSTSSRRSPIPIRRPTSSTSKKSESKTSFSEPVYLEADERTNRILMIGLADQLDIVEKLIDSLDLEQQDMRIMRSYEIQHADADEVVQKLEELGILSSSNQAGGSGLRSSGRSATGRLTAGRPSAAGAAKETVTSAGSGESSAQLLEEPLVVIIGSTNSLLVKATVQQHQEIASIIAYIDRERLTENLPFVVYQLENQDPEELTNTLKQLIQETAPAAASNAAESTGTKLARPTSTATATAARNAEEDITIVPDMKTRSLIVYASKKNQQWISAMIKDLDGYMPQVLFEITLVQVTKNDAFTFDLELLSAIPDMAIASGQVPGLPAGDTTLPFNDIYNKLVAAKKDQGINRSSFIEGKTKEGKFTGFYGNDKINALLTAMQTKNYGRVMNRPKLLVNDGEEGTIQATSTTYVKKTDTSQSTGDNPVIASAISYPDYSTGITLTITPEISKGDMLKLTIDLNRSDFTEIPDGEKPPDKVDTNINTKITVPNGHTIILGGLEKINSSKGGSKVPLLGDLPLIGGLFREVAEASGQDKLYIFVKANILRPGDELGLNDLKNVSDQDRQRFEKLETELQDYDTWPGVKAKPMDPLKVLETN